MLHRPGHGGSATRQSRTFHSLFLHLTQPSTTTAVGALVTGEGSSGVGKAESAVGEATAVEGAEGDSVGRTLRPHLYIHCGENTPPCCHKKTNTKQYPTQPQTRINGDWLGKTKHGLTAYSPILS